MSDSMKTIGFRGTEKYREELARAALDRGMKVQKMLERAVSDYLAKPSSQKLAPSPSPPNVIPDTLSALPPEDRETIQSVIQIFQEGGAATGIVRSTVEAWKESKAGQDLRQKNVKAGAKRHAV